VFDRGSYALIGTIDIESETPDAFGADVQALLENLFRLDPTTLETLIHPTRLQSLRSD